MLSLTQKQSQGQRLTPQQLQYLKLLQLSGVALEQRVKEELEVNPLLEEQEDARLERSDERADGGEKEDIEWDELMAGTWDPFRPAGSRSDEMTDVPQQAHETLTDRILTQIRMSALEDHEVVLAEEIIGNIDGDGYLRRKLIDIVDDLNRFVADTDAVRLLDLPQEERESFSTQSAGRPFGRDRLLYDIKLDRENQVGSSEERVDETAGESIAAAAPTPANTLPADTVAENDGVAADTSADDERTIADLSLEEMAALPIEELARILERGTVATTSPAPAVATSEPAPAAPEKNGTGADDTPQPPSSPSPAGFFTLPDAERILHRIQRLDPPAIGARSLQESLSIQLELLEDDTPGVDVARRVIDRAYQEFTMKHFEKICRKIDCEEEDLREAIDLITTLNPKPGDGSVSGIVETNYVTPDFVIERDGDSFIILPNDSFIPTLRINPGYKEMLAKKGSDGKKGRKRANVDRGTQKFLRTKMESAKWFIASIHQRRQTMLRVMEAILEIQAPFFRGGPDYLKPMIYRDIAEKIGMDISTVCRVVNGKYVQTDYGVFELRYFFSEALETAWGEEVSNKVVKSRIREMIEAEDKNKPLSDDVISKKMKESGYPVARRTVAKYREQMNIPIARLRRTL